MNSVGTIEDSPMEEKKLESGRHLAYGSIEWTVLQLEGGSMKVLEEKT